MKNKLKNIDKQLIIDDYKSNLKILEIRKKYKISTKTIYDILDKFDVPRNFNTNRKYEFNQNYFDVIDTKDKAYFLGWLYSDGNNFPSTGNITLKIQESDKIILENFIKKVSNSYHPIYLSERSKKNSKLKNQVTLKLCSVYMSSKLLKLGVVKAKSLILTFPTEEQVPKHLQSHFIRGYFDGDGCICKYLAKKDKNPTFQFIITATFNFNLRLQEILIDNIGLNKVKLVKNKNNFNLNYGGNKQVKKIGEWLYKDCDDLYLPRKKEKFDILINKI